MNKKRSREEPTHVVLEIKDEKTPTLSIYFVCERPYLTMRDLQALSYGDFDSVEYMVAMDKPWIKMSGDDEGVQQFTIDHWCELIIRTDKI